MLALLSQRNFFLLWIAHTISILGDYVFFIAITFWIYEQTGSASATGTVLIVSTVPSIFFAPLAGMLVDRWDRRRIMFVAESARALLFLGLLGALIMQPHTLWPIYVVGFVQSALASFFWPARSALIPQMIKPTSLLTSNALYLVSDSAVRVVAPSLSAFVLLRSGPAGVVILDATSFVISAGCVCLLTPATQRQIEPISVLRREHTSLLQQHLPLQSIEPATKRAWWVYTTIKAKYWAGVLFALGSIVAYTSGTLSILFPIFAHTTLSTGPLVYGWILTAQAIGEGVMSLLLGRMHAGQKSVKVIAFVSVYLAVGGLVLMLIAQFHTLVSVLLLNLIFGAMTAATTIHLLTFLQQRIPNRFLGRTLAAYTALQALSQVGGMAVATIMVALVGAIWLLVFDGALYLLGSILVWLLLTKDTIPEKEE